MGQPTHQMIKMQFALFHNAVDKEYKLSEFNPQRPQGLKEKMDALGQEVEKLLKTWSVMAGRNVMLDIQRTIEALETLVTAPNSRAAVIGLKKNVLKGLEGHQLGKARYTSALCIGWKVQTAWDSFKGETDDRDDMVHKAEAMVKAIVAARNEVTRQGYDTPEMLKIFMAPEFYFRGIRGAYGFDDVNGLKNEKSLAQIMREELDKPDYKDWLFVLGTVIAASKNVHSECAVPSCKAGLQFEVDKVTGRSKASCLGGASHQVVEKVLGANVDNVALVVKEKFVHSVSKELISNKDFNARPGTDYEVTVGSDALHPVKDTNPNGFKDERMGGSIFTIDGLTFGLEICLDHIASGAKSDAGRLDHAGNIQIQLLPSGGMSVKKFRTVKNGLIFNVDGKTPHVQAIGMGHDPKTGAEIVQNFLTKGGAYGQEYAKTWEEMKNELEKKVNTLTYQPVSSGAAEAVIVYGPFSIPAV
jgi:hypothetical protein